MAKSDRPVALVTGASRGAGAGIARALGSYGMRVYVTGYVLKLSVRREVGMVRRIARHDS
jgi:NAD(P)-dependent dehydrogenase (short-subunit alcohol dehydrogenase family)